MTVGKKYFVFGLLITIVFIACKKDTINEPETPEQVSASTTYPNYSNLKIGNYWIYQRFELDGSGGETPLAIIDSCYIEKDTLINSNTYFKYVSPNFGVTITPSNSTSFVAEFFRDSLSYIISSTGRIEFSSQDFTTIFYSYYGIAGPNDTICRVECQMKDQNVSVTTPAGTFVTSNFKETQYMYPNYMMNGAIKYRSRRYAENIGKVTQEWYLFAITPTRWERRLIRYHLN
ncbi:MAG: hypothetical protein V4565_10700 [Bacteroidota bacterium]